MQLVAIRDGADKFISLFYGLLYGFITEFTRDKSIV